MRKATNDYDIAFLESQVIVLAIYGDNIGQHVKLLTSPQYVLTLPHMTTMLVLAHVHLRFVVGTAVARVAVSDLEA